MFPFKVEKWYLMINFIKILIHEDKALNLTREPFLAHHCKSNDVTM